HRHSSLRPIRAQQAPAGDRPRDLHLPATLHRHRDEPQGAGDAGTVVGTHRDVGASQLDLAALSREARRPRTVAGPKAMREALRRPALPTIHMGADRVGTPASRRVAAAATMLRDCYA